MLQPFTGKKEPGTKEKEKEKGTCTKSLLSEESGRITSRVSGPSGWKT